MSNYPTYLIHYGIQGQKWGVRRFQNEDGTYTDEGLRRRRLDDQKSFYKEVKKDVRKGTFDPKKYKTNAFVKDQIQKTNIKRLIKDRDEFNKEYRKLEKNEKKRDKIYSEYQNKVNQDVAKAIEGKNFKTEEEKYDFSENKRFAAEDKYNDLLYKKLDKAGISWNTKYPIDIGGFEEKINKSSAVAAVFDQTVDSIVGKYSNKKIKGKTVREYVNDIVAEMANEKHLKRRA